MRDPVIVLAAPRSFTSVVCAMLGQHPELYGLPEVNLFIAETMRERKGVLARRKFFEHGLLRAVAQLFAGAQTVRSIVMAQRWVEMRAARTCVSVFEELGERASGRGMVEKSPRTVTRCEYLRRVHGTFRNARFIHLVRHPRSQGESLWRAGGAAAGEALDALDYGTDPAVVDYQKAWYSLNMNVVTFLDAMPKDQQIRIRGEELLRDSDTYLRKLARWLGVRTDRDALEAMRHPERSPYACFGPVNARFGNDPHFLRAPALRSGVKFDGVSLEGPLAWRGDGRGFSPEVKDLAREFGYR